MCLVSAALGLCEARSVYRRSSKARFRRQFHDRACELAAILSPARLHHERATAIQGSGPHIYEAADQFSSERFAQRRRRSL